MSKPVEREGSYRVEIIDYGIKKMDSGAVSVALRVKILQWFGAFEQGQEPQWYDFTGEDMEAEGDVWVVGGKDKGNKVNERAIESLVKCAGWDGDFASITNHTWEPATCQALIKAETYKNVTRMKIAFLNEWDRTPGGSLSNVGGDEAKMLATMYGAKIRALASNAKRNAAPTSGRPAAPPSDNPHNSPPIQAWTIDKAIMECKNAGISREQLAEAIKAKGFTGWNMIRDTPTAKALIEAAMGQPAMAPAPGTDGGDIPF